MSVILPYADLIDAADVRARSLRAWERGAVEAGWRKAHDPRAIREAQIFEALAEVVRYCQRGEFHRFDAESLRYDPTGRDAKAELQAVAAALKAASPSENPPKTQTEPKNNLPVSDDRPFGRRK